MVNLFTLKTLQNTNRKDYSAKKRQEKLNKEYNTGLFHTFTNSGRVYAAEQQN